MPGFDTNRFIDLNEDLTKHLICSICLNIFDGAVRSRCEHTFCKSCVQQWIESNHKECPECRVNFEARKRSKSTRSADKLVLIRNFIFKSNLMANSIVSELKIKCDFDFNGCQQSVKLQSLSSHVKDCPHRLCAKCGFTFIVSVEHNSVNCIELLKNDRNDFKGKYEKQIQFTNEWKQKFEKQLEVNEELKGKYENQLEINNKLKEENRELKTKLQTNEKSLQNNNNNTIDAKEESINSFICNSIENIYFGTFKTTSKYMKVDQDQFHLLTIKKNYPNNRYVYFNLSIPFIDCEEFKYCKDPSLRIVMIRPIKRSGQQIKESLGLDQGQFYNTNSIVSSNRYIIVVFEDNTQQFERCVKILESVKTQIKVQEINKEVAKCYVEIASKLIGRADLLFEL